MKSKIKRLLNSQSGKIYVEVLEEIRNDNYSPHEFIKKAYHEIYEIRTDNNHATNGKIFEYLICETLKLNKITPFYFQAKLINIPDVTYDILCYNREYPIVLSCKTSLRERYKQAENEGSALNKVYRNAESYLLTLNEKESKRLNAKIRSKEVADIKSCVLASSPEFDKLIEKLKTYDFSKAKSVNPINSQEFIR